MKKRKSKIFIGVAFLLTVLFASCKPETFDCDCAQKGGVVINGVCWAKCNVDAFGTFATRPEDYGMFYQWNRPTAWNSTDVEVAGWDDTYPTGISWTTANDPSPEGWRVPTHNELRTLLDIGKVSSKRTSSYGINGRRFTDKSSGNSIFLPAAGTRARSDGYLTFAGSSGMYWSSEDPEHQDGGADAYYLDLGYDDAVCWYTTRNSGFSIRPVAK